MFQIRWLWKNVDKRYRVQYIAAMILCVHVYDDADQPLSDGQAVR